MCHALLFLIWGDKLDQGVRYGTKISLELGVRDRSELLLYLPEALGNLEYPRERFHSDQSGRLLAGTGLHVVEVTF